MIDAKCDSIGSCTYSKHSEQIVVILGQFKMRKNRFNTKQINPNLLLMFEMLLNSIFH